MPRPQFRLRSLFIVTAIVAVRCLVGPPLRATFWPYIVDEGHFTGGLMGLTRTITWSDGTTTVEQRPPVIHFEDRDSVEVPQSGIDAPLPASPPTN